MTQQGYIDECECNKNCKKENTEKCTQYYKKKYMKYKLKCYKFQQIYGLQPNTYDNYFYASDHLAVIIDTFIGDQKLRVCTFNCLLQKWLEINVMAKNSHISKYFSHIISKKNRENIIGEVIYNMLLVKHVDIVGLQEVSNNVMMYINERIVNNTIMMISPLDFTQVNKNDNLDDKQIILYNTNRLHIDVPNNKMVYYNGGKSKYNKRILDVTFKLNNEKIRFINTHVMHKKFAFIKSYVENINKCDITTIVVGDMNCSSSCGDFVVQCNDINSFIPYTFTFSGTSIKKVALPMNGNIYVTHVNSKGKYVCYDNIFVFKII